MIVHFICRGNAYRSRLAEAYLNSKGLTVIKAISSGTHAEINKLINGPVSWYAMRILQNNLLVPFMSFNSQQTVKELLSKSDYIVFMESAHLNFCRENFGFDSDRFEIWNIVDIDPLSKEESKLINVTEITFSEIKKKADELIEKIKKT